MPNPAISPQARIRWFNQAHHHGHISSDDDCLFIERLRRAGLSTEHIAATLETIENTCNGCWDADAGCKCCNDE